MALPSNIDTATIEYRITFDADITPPALTASLGVGNLGTEATEAYAAAYDDAWQAFCEVMLNAPGVSGCHIYRSYTGSTQSTDIFVTP